MPEANVNAEIAQHLHEHGVHKRPDGPSHRRIEIIEILEAVLLALVALATAFSGYEAARWDGESAKAYAESSRLRAESNEKQLTAHQQLAYDASTFTAWLEAYDAGDKSLQKLLSRRFTPEYTVAFDAWLALDPFNDPDAPPGPRYMPEYKDPLTEKASALAKEATAAFEEGVESRRRGEHFVQITVILAAVLFLLALGQRFKIRGVRYALTIVAGGFLVYSIVLIATYPHA